MSLNSVVSQIWVDLYMKYVGELELKASKGYIRDWYTSDKTKSQASPKNNNLLLGMFESDPVLFSVVNTIVNKTFGEGFRLVGNNQQAQKKLEKKLSDLNFDLVLPNIIRNVVIYGDAFLELVYDDSNKVSELHVLETREMEIKQDEHGDVLGYVQMHGGKDPVNFGLDEVIHFVWIEIGSRVWGFTPFTSLLTTVATKKFAETHNRTKFQNNSPRIVWIAKEASEEQIKELISYLKLAKENPHKDIVVEGDIDFKKLMDNTGDDNNINLLDYLRTQILMAMQMPPIMVGLPDNSNRSNSEVQLRAFEGNIRALQRPITHKINNYLFKLLGFEQLTMEFKPIDKRGEDVDMNIAKGLKELGVKSEDVIDYLRSVGLQLPENLRIEEPKPMPMVEGQEPDKPFMGKKTGAQAETRPEQLVGKSKKVNFNEYPYVI